MIVLENLTPRDRKILFYGAAAVAVILFYSLAMEPLWKSYLGFKSEALRSAGMIRRYRTFIESAQERERQIKRLESEFSNLVASCFLANTEALATGQLAQIVRDKALSAGLALKSSKPEKAEFVDGFQLLNLSVTFNSSLANLARFVKEVHNDQKEIVIRKARLTSQKESYADDTPEMLSAKLLLTGLRFMPKK